jgi:predicted RNA methylase
MTRHRLCAANRTGCPIQLLADNSGGATDPHNSKMNSETLNRLHALRMANDAARYEQQEMRPRFDRLAQRHENGTAPRAVVAFQLFQTPPDIAAQLVAMLELKPGARVLEPSAGLGRLLDALKPFAPSEVVAVEIAASCAAELFRQERAGVVLKKRDFLTVTPEEIGLFDAVAMNPPFHMRADIRHIEHARNFLKPGGKLAAICMDTPQRHAALRFISSQWVTLPASSFAETGTKIGAIMLIINAP